MSTRRPPARLEKHEQAEITKLLRSVGGTVWTLGTHRRRGDHQGTMQSPGLPDLWAILPPRDGGKARGLWVEVKRSRGGHVSPEQRAFRDQCIVAGVPHVIGDLDAVIAWLIGEGYLRPDRVPHYRLQKEAV